MPRYPKDEDANAIHDNVSGEIVLITEQTVVDKDDAFLIEDSTSSDAKKRIEHSNLMSQPFAGIQAENQNTGVALTVLSQYEIYDQFETNGIARRCTPDQANNRIEIDEDGAYYVEFMGTALGTSGENFQWEIHVGAARTYLSARCNGNDFSPEVFCAVNASGHLNLSDGDLVDLRVRCYTNATATARGKDMYLNVHRIGPKTV